VTARVGGAAALLAAAVALLPGNAARAEEELVARTKAVGLGAAVSISHGTDPGLDALAGYQLLPHVGYVVTDAHGPDWVRGNFEVLVEPALIRLDSDDGSANVVGASALTRWVFQGTGRYRPFVEAGVGVLLGESTLAQTDCAVNFLLQAGPGVLVFLSDTTVLTVGYRFQHISNGGACQYNVGINSSALYVGVSRLFR
jgi:hypothetical protein